MTFRVEVSAQAESDAEEILNWLLSEGAGEAGIRWFHGLEDALPTGRRRADSGKNHEGQTCKVCPSHVCN